MEFTYCKLIDVLSDIHSGGTPSTEVSNYWGGTLKWLSSGETSQRFISDTIARITEDGVKYSSTKLAKKSNVVMACAGQGKTRGQTSFLLDDMYINQSVIALEANKAIHPLYLFYNLSLRYDELRGGSDASSTRGSITTTALKNLPFKYPDLTTQKRIVDILYTYDNLIENNNRRIVFLEKAAQELYKEWFVRFRFPGYEANTLVDSRLGKIPSCFDVIKMKEAIVYYVGGGWGNDEYSNEFTEKAYVIRGTDFPRVQKGDLTSCPLRYHKPSNYSSRELKENDIIVEVSGGTAEQPVGRTLIMAYDIIDRLGGKVICASFCKLIRLNQEIISPYFFYYWMQFLYDTRIIDRFQLQSTGIINFKFEYFLRKGDILLPPKPLMDKFEMKVKSFQNEISLLAKQNENLIKQRDLLLPRLISGNLEV